jgi:hypothetical protein
MMPPSWPDESTGPAVCAWMVAQATLGRRRHRVNPETGEVSGIADHAEVLRATLRAARAELTAVELSARTGISPRQVPVHLETDIRRGRVATCEPLGTARQIGYRWVFR